MDQSGGHPITTPKGTTLLTVILAVIGVFTPFFASLQTAQLFAAVAVLVIIWLYAEEARGCVKAKSGYLRMIAPATSILIICGVAVGATLLVSARTQPTQPPPITLKELSDTVARALAQKAAPMPAPAAQSFPRTPDFRIIIQDPVPLPAAPRSTAPILKTPDEVMADKGGYLRRKLARQVATMDADVACVSKHMDLSIGLTRLINEAIEYQNAFVYGRNQDKIISDSKIWISSVEGFFESNKSELPDVEIVRLASRGQDQRTFLGIKQAGYRTWADMDAKREALRLILKQVSDRTCSHERAEAIAKCLEDERC